MSARAVPSARRQRRPPVRAVHRRRRILAVFAAAAVAGISAMMLLPTFHEAVREISLPLRHEDIIRQQAQDKDIDPALIAAVIYAESRFIDDRTSAAGAQGLMQITPETARDIARKSGGVQFRVEDLGTPQVNISYGAYYLRYLLRRYGGNEALALAAYNGGEGNVDRWIAHARGHGRGLRPDDIPFPETREYVRRVTSAKADYRRTYARELGIR